MTRHIIPSKNPELSVVVGWDNPLDTFFGQVVRDARDDAGEEDDPVVFWVGAKPQEIPDPFALVALLEPYAELTAGMLVQLRADKREGMREPPTALQKLFRR